MSDTDRARQRQLLEFVFSDVEKAREYVERDRSVLEARDGVGETAFHYVVVEDERELAKHLLEWGSDVNTLNDFGETPLMLAAFLGYLEMVKWLVASGADLDIKDESEETALSKASRNDRADVFRYLLSLPRAHPIDFYYDDLTATDVHRDLTLVMRDELLGLGLSKRFEE